MGYCLMPEPWLPIRIEPVAELRRQRDEKRSNVQQLYILGGLSWAVTLLGIGIIALSAAVVGNWPHSQPVATYRHWRDNPEQVSLSSARVPVKVLLRLNAHQIVVEDSRRRRWLLVVEEGAVDRQFGMGEIISLERTVYQNRPELWLATPARGYAWVMPLKDVRLFQSTEI
jgi:hypothetical protein